MTRTREENAEDMRYEESTRVTEEIYTITVAGVKNHKQLENVLANYIDGFTASYADGYDKNYGFEQVAVVKIFAVSDRTVRALVQAMLREFNQKEITVEDVYGQVEFHKLDSMTRGLGPGNPIPEREGVYPTAREQEFGLEKLSGTEPINNEDAIRKYFGYSKTAWQRLSPNDRAKFGAGYHFDTDKL